VQKKKRMFVPYQHIYVVFRMKDADSEEEMDRVKLWGPRFQSLFTYDDRGTHQADNALYFYRFCCRTDTDMNNVKQDLDTFMQSYQHELIFGGEFPGVKIYQAVQISDSEKTEKE
jgi:hypothetical protein